MPKLNLAKLAEVAMADYRNMIVALARGKDRDPEEVMQIAVRAGRSLPQVQSDVQLVESRFAARAECDNARYDERADHMMAEYRSLVKEREEVQAQLEPINQRLRELREREQRAVQHNTIRQQGLDHMRRVNVELSKTGLNGSSDPSAFALTD